LVCRLEGHCSDTSEKIDRFQHPFYSWRLRFDSSRWIACAESRTTSFLPSQRMGCSLFIRK
jgi:hypothetical protein